MFGYSICFWTSIFEQANLGWLSYGSYLNKDKVRMEVNIIFQVNLLTPVHKVKKASNKNL